VEQIEVLLLLFGDPGRSWNTEEISATLRSSAHSIASRLPRLQATRLVAQESEGAFRYAATGHLHEMVEMLQKEYAARRFSVIDLVYSHGDAARAFADAFRFKDEDDEARS
jgi:hypothetical protein